MGTVGNGFNATDLERYSQTAGIPIAKQNEIAKKLYDSAYYQQAMGKRDWAAGNIQALRRFSKILGTNVSDMTPDQFWKKMFEKLGKELQVSYWPCGLWPSLRLVLQIRPARVTPDVTQDIMDTVVLLPDTNVLPCLNETGREAFSDEIPYSYLNKRVMDDFSVEDYGIFCLPKISSVH